MGGFVGGCTKGGSMQGDTKGETGRDHGRRFREKHMERDITGDMLEMQPLERRHSVLDEACVCRGLQPQRYTCDE